MTSRTRGSVPNIKRAVREGDAARAERKSNINSARAGTTGSKLNDHVSGALR